MLVYVYGKALYVCVLCYRRMFQNVFGVGMDNAFVQGYGYVPCCEGQEPRIESDVNEYLM